LNLDIFFDDPKTALQSAQIYIGIGDIRDEGDKRVIICGNRSQPAGPLGLDFPTELSPEINLPGSREEKPIGEDIGADLYIALV
jgi:hypothetical protein